MPPTSLDHDPDLYRVIPPPTPQRPRCYVFLWGAGTEDSPLDDGLHRHLLALCDAFHLAGPIFIADRPTRRLFRKVAPGRGDHVVLLEAAFPSRRQLARAVSFCLRRGAQVHLIIADKPSLGAGTN